MVRRPTHAALVATIGVKDARGGTFELKPEERFYEQGADGQAMPEVAISFGVFSDLYLNTVDIDAQQGIATLEVFVNPLVNWIWVGGALLTLGGLICLVPVRKAKKSGQGAKDPQHRDAVALTVPLNVQGNGTVNGRRSVASSPMKYWRTALCPTMQATFTPRCSPTAARYSATLFQRQRTDSRIERGMASTRTKVPINALSSPLWRASS